MTAAEAEGAAEAGAEAEAQQEAEKEAEKEAAPTMLPQVQGMTGTESLTPMEQPKAGASVAEFLLSFRMMEQDEDQATNFLVKRKSAVRKAFDRARANLGVMLPGVRKDYSEIIGSDTLHLTIEIVARHFGVDIREWTLMYSKTSYERVIDGKPYIFTTGVYQGTKLNLTLEHPFYDKRLARRMTKIKEQEAERLKREAEALALEEGSAEQPPPEQPPPAPPAPVPPPADEPAPGDDGEGAPPDGEQDEAKAEAEAKAGEGEGDGAAEPKQERLPENTVPPGSLIDFTRFDIPRYELPTEAHWRDAIRSQPFDEKELDDIILARAMQMANLPIDISEPWGDDLACEGMHQLWEFAAQKKYHAWLQTKEDYIPTVTKGLLSDSMRVRALACCALWSCSITKALRKAFTAAGAVQAVVENVKLCILIPETEPHDIEDVIKRREENLIKMEEERLQRMRLKKNRTVVDLRRRDSDPSLAAMAAEAASEQEEAVAAPAGDENHPPQGQASEASNPSAAQPSNPSASVSLESFVAEEEEKASVGPPPRGHMLSNESSHEGSSLREEMSEQAMQIQSEGSFHGEAVVLDEKAKIGISGLPVGKPEKKQHYKLRSSEARWRLAHACVGALGLLLLDKEGRFNYFREDSKFDLLLNCLEKIPTDYLCFAPGYSVPLEYGRTLEESRGWFLDDRRLRMSENLVSMLLRDGTIRNAFLSCGGVERLLDLMAQDETPVTQKFLYTQSLSVFASNPQGLSAMKSGDQADKTQKAAQVNLTSLRLVRESSGDILDAFKEMAESIDIISYGHGTESHVHAILAKRPEDLEDDDESRLALQWAMSSAVIYWTGVAGAIIAGGNNAFRYMISLDDIKRHFIMMEHCIILLYLVPVTPILHCLSGSLALFCQETPVLKKTLKIVHIPNGDAIKKVFTQRGEDPPKFDNDNSCTLITILKCVMHLPNPPEDKLRSIIRAKNAAMASIANIAALELGAVGVDCLDGPYRLTLVDEDMFHEIDHICEYYRPADADSVSGADQSSFDDLDNASSIAILYMCTAGQVKKTNHFRTPAELGTVMDLTSKCLLLRPALCYIAGIWVLLRIRENRLIMLQPDEVAEPKDQRPVPRLLTLLEKYALRWMSALEADCQRDPGEDPEPGVADAIKAFEFWISALWLALVDEPEYDHIPTAEEVYEMAVPPEAERHFKSWFTVPSRTPVNLSRIPNVSLMLIQALVHILGLPRFDESDDGDGYWRCRQLTIRLCWSLCIRDGRVQRDLLENNILEPLLRIMRDDAQRVEIRIEATWLTMHLASQTYNVREFFADGSTAELEDALLHFVRGPNVELERVGMLSMDFLLFRPCDLQHPQAQEAGKLTREAQLRFVPNDGARCAVGLLRRHFHALLAVLEVKAAEVKGRASMRSRQKAEAAQVKTHLHLIDLALIALRNSSVRSENHIPLAKMAMHLLLITHAAFSFLEYENLAIHTSYILRNLAHHPDNRTRFYKMELRGVWNLLAQKTQKVLDAHDAAGKRFLDEKVEALSSDRSHYKKNVRKLERGSLRAVERTAKKLGVPVARTHHGAAIAKALPGPKADFFRAAHERPPSAQSDASYDPAAWSETSDAEADEAGSEEGAEEGGDDTARVSTGQRQRGPNMPIVDGSKLNFLDWLDETFPRPSTVLSDASTAVGGGGSLMGTADRQQMPDFSIEAGTIGSMTDRPMRRDEDAIAEEEDADLEVSKVNEVMDDAGALTQRHLQKLRELTEIMFSCSEHFDKGKLKTPTLSVLTPRPSVGDLVLSATPRNASRIAVRQSGQWSNEFITGRTAEAYADPNVTKHAANLRRRLAGEERAHIPAVHSALKKPLRGMYREPPAEVRRKGKERWNPPLAEYRQPVEKANAIPRVARKLLDVHRPEGTTAHLALAAQGLAVLRGNDGPAVGGGHLPRPPAVKSVVRDRPVAQGFKRDEVPLTVLLPPRDEKLPRNDSSESLRDMYLKSVIPKLKLPAIEADAESESAAVAAEAAEAAEAEGGAEDAYEDAFEVPGAEEEPEAAVDEEATARAEMDDAMPADIRKEWVPTERRSLNVVLTPSRARNNIGFANLLEKSSASELLKEKVARMPKLTMFEHVRGSKIGREYFPVYRMPNGKLSHYFYTAGTVADEVSVYLPAGPERPVDLHLAFQHRLPVPSGLDSITYPDTSSLPPPYYPIPRTCREYPDLVSEETLAKSDRQPPIDTMSKAKTKCYPMHMLISTEQIEQERTGKVEKEIRPPWNIHASVFGPRRKESESRAYFDSEVLLGRMFDKDWEHLTNKRKVCSMMLAEGKKDGKQPPEIMSSVKEVLHRHKVPLIKAFNFFACCQSGNPLLQALNEYTEFIVKADIADPESKFCKTSDLDTIFITANFQEDKKMAQNSKQVNNEKQLMRFEFLECVIRTAVAKYMKDPVLITDLAEAVDKLITDHVLASLSNEAIYDPNDFRRDRLYFEENDLIYKKHLPMLKTIYSRYRLPPTPGAVRTKMMRLEGWSLMLEEGGLISFDFTLNEARLCWLWCRMLVSDEVGLYDNNVRVTFVDMLDALGRVADYMSLPTEVEYKKHQFANIYDWKLARDNSPDLLDTEGKPMFVTRPSSVFGAPKTRPLHVKIHSLLDLMFRALDYHPGEEFSYDGLKKRMAHKDKELGP